DGVQVSEHADVNAAGVEHYFAVWSAGPRARVQPQQQVVRAPAELQLDGAGSTASAGATVTQWRWTQREGPTGIALAATSGQRLVLQQPGRYVFELSIVDSEGHTSAPARAEVVVEGDV